MLEKLDVVICVNDYVDLDDIESDIVTFFSDGMGLNTIDLNNINLNDDNFDEQNLKTIAWCNKLNNNKKYVKKD